MIKSLIYTDEQVKFIVDNIRGTSRKELTNLLNERFNTNFKVSQVANFCSRHGLKNGRNTQFKKGETPFNKGLKWDEYMSEEGQRNSLKTTFQKGHLGGNAFKKYQPVGYERVLDDGYVTVKVNDDYPLTKRWKLKHYIVWEQANGKVPDDSRLMFLDGDRTNCNIDNLALVKKAEMLSFNQLRLPQNDPEITKLGIVTARIRTKIKELKRNEKTLKKEKGD